MRIETKLGLPLLREETVNKYMMERGEIMGFDKTMAFYQVLFAKIKNYDPLYAEFIERASKMYAGEEDQRVAWAELTEGYELLSRSGELPKLERDKFQRRWDATMNRSVAVLNVGANMDLILDDNPFYWAFIMDSSNFFPGGDESEELTKPGPRMCWLSDASCGYMFLVDARGK